MREGGRVRKRQREREGGRENVVFERLLNKSDD